MYPGENFVYSIQILDELGHSVFSAIQAIQGRDTPVSPVDVSIQAYWIEDYDLYILQ